MANKTTYTDKKKLTEVMSRLNETTKRLNTELGKLPLNSWGKFQLKDFIEIAEIIKRKGSTSIAYREKVNKLLKTVANDTEFKTIDNICSLLIVNTDLIPHIDFTAQGFNKTLESAKELEKSCNYSDPKLADIQNICEAINSASYLSIDDKKNTILMGVMYDIDTDNFLPDTSILNQQ